jgi:ferric-dicitrate binding protein FerR (iron transport regulator)
LEKLALYQDQLLPDWEQRQIQEELSAHPEYQEDLRELDRMQESLQEWGRKERVFLALQNRLQQPARRSLPASERNYFVHWLPSLNPVPAVSFAAVLILFVSALFAVRSFMPSSPEVLKNFGTTTIATDTARDQECYVEVGQESYLALRLTDGKSIAEFGPNTRAVIEGERTIRLQEGVVLNRVAPMPDLPYQVYTPQGVIQVLGTQFEVEIQTDRTVVRVLDGKVALRTSADHTPGSAVLLTKGQMGTITSAAVSSPQPISLKSIAPWRQAFGSNANITTKNIANVLHSKP